MSTTNDRPRFIFAIIGVGIFLILGSAAIWGTSKLIQAVSDGRNAPVVEAVPDTIQYSDTAAQSRMSLMVNGRDSSVTITTGSYTVTMRAEDMKICMLTEPAQSLISPESMKMTIESSHPWYPKPGGRTLFAARCAGLDGSVQWDSVIVSR